MIGKVVDFRFEGSQNQEKKSKFKANLAHQSTLEEMSDEFSLALVFQWLDTMIAALDCYTWVFSQGYLNPRLFRENPQSRLISALTYFISHIAMNSLSDLRKYFPSTSAATVFTPTDTKEFETAKCTVTVRLLNFLTSLWSKYPQDTLQTISHSFYNEHFIRLILVCVFNPTQLGFDINNEEINKKLPERVRLGPSIRSPRSFTSE